MYLSLLRTKAVVPIVKASKSNPADRKTLKLATNGNQERSNSTYSLTKVDFVSSHSGARHVERDCLRSKSP